MSLTAIKDGLKKCNACKQIKPVEQFHKRKDRLNGNGRNANCRSCVRAKDMGRPRSNTQYAKDRRKIDVDYYRKSNLKRTYGITIDYFNHILRIQNGVCKICYGPPMGKGAYHVDHCHKTGKIRGLLCHKCNVALGMVGDNMDILRKLINYISTNGETT